MKILVSINVVITLLFVVCYGYQLLYIPLSLFKRKKSEKHFSFENHYAVLICARNEENVIGDLLEDLKRQTYPSRLLDIFVLADNCQDSTALIAGRKGATVYKRRNLRKTGKGYALNELLENIKKDHGLDYDGYFVFDADNLLKEDFIERMNDTFCLGYDIVTSYRNSKNPFSSWISFGHSLWFIRDRKSTRLNSSH